MMKIESRPRSRDVAHWPSEGLVFQVSAQGAFSSSVRRLLAVDQIWETGRTFAKGSGDSVPSTCSFTLDEVLSDDFDLDAAPAKLDSARRAGT